MKGVKRMDNNQALKQASLQITGMTCAACANRIEKGLNKLDGVQEANVNFAMEKASVMYDPGKVDTAQMEATIKKLGYYTAKDSVDLQLIGMTCAACANRIEKGLGKLPGVSKATVNFALESAHVEYNASELSVEDMLKKVEKLGYRAELKEGQEDKEDHRKKEISTQKMKLIVSSIL